MPSAPTGGGYDPRKLKSDEGACSELQTKMKQLMKQVESLGKQGSPQDVKIKKAFEKAVADIRKNAETIDKQSSGFDKQASSGQKKKPKDQQKQLGNLMKSVGGINQMGTALAKSSKSLEAMLKKGARAKSKGKADPSADQKALKEAQKLQSIMTEVMKKYNETAKNVIQSIGR